MLLLALSLAVLPQNLHLDLPGDAADGRFGSSVSCAGDVNADGWPDLLVGAKYHPAYFVDGGQAKVISGKDRSELYVLWGEAEADIFGSYVNELGDLNQDGFDDFGVAAKANDSTGENAGKLQVFSGKDGTVLYELFGNQPHDFFSQSFVSIGDLNQDGAAEILVGARQSDPKQPGPGYAQVFSGIDGQLLATVTGDDDFDWFGKFVGAPGDINQDGTPDFLVGAKGDDNIGTDSGMVRLYSGVDASIIHQWDGPDGSWFGTICDAAGDVNADGIPDILIGAYRNSTNGKTKNGTMFVYSGADFSELLAIHGEHSYDWFSKSCATLGDINGDGHADLASGAYMDDNFGEKSGTVRVYSGADGEILYTLNGRNTSDNFGYVVSDAGDINQDGIIDLIAGARNAGGDGSGAARVYTMWTYILNAPTSMTAGTTRLISIAGGGPSGLVKLFAAGGTGTWLSPPGLGPYPLSLDLKPTYPANLITLPNNQNGYAELWYTASLNLKGRHVYFQALDLKTWTVSNLARVEIR